MDILDELNGSQEPNAEAVIEAAEPVQAEPQTAEPEAEQETAEQKATRERDEKGRFKAKEEPVMVPLQALHETRDEVKALKAELEKLRQPQAQQAPQVPDIFENPEGFTGHIQNQIALETAKVRGQFSHTLAVKTHGQELVDAATQWGIRECDANPAFNAQAWQNPDPFEFIVQQYQRATLMSQLDDPATLEQFNKWREAQSAPQPTPQPAPIPTSLADQQSARGGGAAYQPPSLDDILKG